MSGVFINLLTDFGFKRIFGTEENKHLLMDFLNQQIPNQTIVELDYLPTENKGDLADDRAAIFDLHCKTADDEYVLIEVQRGYQENFKDRSIYYSSCAIQKHARKGKWDYQLPKVYTICLMEFCFQPIHKQKLITHMQLCDVETGNVFYDKIRFIYVQLPLFTKSLDMVDNRLEKWLFLLQKLQHLQKDVVEDNFVEPLFREVVHLAEVVNMTKEQKLGYDASWKRYNDYHNTIDYAKKAGLQKGIEIGRQQGIEQGRQEGIEQGMQKGRLEGKREGEWENKIAIAKNMLAKDLYISLVSEVTGLSVEEVRKLQE